MVKFTVEDGDELSSRLEAGGLFSLFFFPFESPNQLVNISCLRTVLQSVLLH